MLNVHLPTRVAILCSHRAPGLLDLLERDVNRGRSYELVALLTSEANFAGHHAVEHGGVPVIVHSILDFYKRRNASLYRDFTVRAAYDREAVELLAPYAPDLIFLDGYLYIATRELLDPYRACVLNLHFSDLTLRHSDGSPLYPGIHAVRDALLDGRTETAATIHLVNDVPDGGAPLVKSWSFPVSPLVTAASSWGAHDMVKAYAFAHQEWMIRAASGPLIHAALALVTSGIVELKQLARLDAAIVQPPTMDAPGPGVAREEKDVAHRPAA